MRMTSPLVVALCVWIIPVLILVSGIIKYNDIDFRASTTFYLAAGLILFALGFKLGAKIHGRKGGKVLSGLEIQKSWARDASQFRKLISVFAWCGIVAASLFSIEMLIIVGVSPGNLSLMREAYSLRQATVLSQVAAVLGAGGYLSLVPAILAWESLSLRIRLLWVLSPLMTSLFSILSAGRQTIIQLALITFFALILRGRVHTHGHKPLRSSLIIGVIVVTAVFYGMSVAMLRNPKETQGTKGKFLSIIFNARIDTRMEAWLDGKPAIIRDGIPELLIYFTHPIPNFYVFYELPKPGPFWGLWELPFLARRLEPFGLVSTTVTSRMDQAYAVFVDDGRFSNVWQTLFRDLIIDFGRLGSLILLLFFGLGAGRAFNNNYYKGGLIWGYLLVGINLVCAYSATSSVISDTLVFFYFVTVIVMYFKYEFRTERRIYWPLNSEVRTARPKR